MCQLLLQVVPQQTHDSEPSCLPRILLLMIHYDIPSFQCFSLNPLSHECTECKGLGCKNKRTRVVCIEEIQVAVESAGAAALGRAGVKEVCDAAKSRGQFLIFEHASSSPEDKLFSYHIAVILFLTHLDKERWLLVIGDWSVYLYISPSLFASLSHLLPLPVYSSTSVSVASSWFF